MINIKLESLKVYPNLELFVNLKNNFDNILSIDDISQDYKVTVCDDEGMYEAEVHMSFVSICVMMGLNKQFIYLAQQELFVDEIYRQLSSNLYLSFCLSAKYVDLETFKLLSIILLPNIREALLSNDGLVYIKATEAVNLDLLKYLIEILNPDDVKSIVTNPLSSTGDDPIEYGLFHSAIDSGNLEIIQYVVSLAPDHISKMLISNGFRAYFEAAKSGDLDILKYLMGIAPKEILADLFSQMAPFICDIKLAILEAAVSHRQKHIVYYLFSFETILNYTVHNPSEDCDAYLQQYIHDELSKLRNFKSESLQNDKDTTFDIDDSSATSYLLILFNLLKRVPEKPEYDAEIEQYIELLASLPTVISQIKLKSNNYVSDLLELAKKKSHEKILSLFETIPDCGLNTLSATNQFDIETTNENSLTGMNPTENDTAIEISNRHQEQNRDRFSESHGLLATLVMQYTNRRIFEDGVCYGVSAKYLDALFCGELDVFFRRLNLIEQNGFLIFREADQIKENIRKIDGYKLNEYEREILNVLSFIENVAIYQDPMIYSDLFNGRKLIQNYTESHYVCAPETMKSSPALLHRSILLCDKSEAEIYLDMIVKMIGMHEREVGILISCNRHAVSLRYHATEKRWYLFNINKSGNFGTNKYQFCEHALCTSELVDELFHGIAGNDHAGLSFNFISLLSDCKLSNILKNLDPAYTAYEISTRRDSNGKSVLHLLLQSDTDVELIKQIIQSGYYNINEKDKDGITLLHLAIFNGNLSLVRYLLTLEVNIECRIEAGHTPLFMAAILNNIEIFHALIIHGANVNSADLDGITPLMVAILNQHSEIADVLIKQPSIDINATTSNGESALHYAVITQNEALIKKLIARHANVNLITINGVTPLMLAARTGNHHVVNMLLHAGATNQNCRITRADEIASMLGYTKIAGEITSYIRREPGCFSAIGRFFSRNEWNACFRSGNRPSSLR